jgi:hypothetical protein
MATRTMDLPEAPYPQATYRLAAECPPCGPPWRCTSTTRLRAAVTSASLRYLPDVARGCTHVTWARAARGVHGRSAFRRLPVTPGSCVCQFKEAFVHVDLAHPTTDA